MGEWSNVYSWLISVIGDPPDPIQAGSSYSTTYNPAEIIAYAAACCIVLLAFRVLFWAIRMVFGGSS